MGPASVWPEGVFAGDDRISNRRIVWHNVVPFDSIGANQDSTTSAKR